MPGYWAVSGGRECTENARLRWKRSRLTPAGGWRSFDFCTVDNRPCREGTSERDEESGIGSVLVVMQDGLVSRCVCPAVVPGPFQAGAS